VPDGSFRDRTPDVLEHVTEEIGPQHGERLLHALLDQRGIGVKALRGTGVGDHDPWKRQPGGDRACLEVEDLSVVDRPLDVHGLSAAGFDIHQDIDDHLPIPSGDACRVRLGARALLHASVNGRRRTMLFRSDPRLVTLVPLKNLGNQVTENS